MNPSTLLAFARSFPQGTPIARIHGGCMAFLPGGETVGFFPGRGWTQDGQTFTLFCLCAQPSQISEDDLAEAMAEGRRILGLMSIEAAE